MTTRYKCPKCGDADHLLIAAEVVVRLHQDSDGDNFETEVAGDTEFTDESFTTCGECGWAGELQGATNPDFDGDAA